MGFPAATPSNPFSAPVAHDQDRLHLRLEKIENNKEVLKKFQQKGTITFIASGGAVSAVFDQAFPAGASVFVSLQQQAALSASIRTEITAISETGFTVDVSPAALGGSPSVTFDYIALATA